MKTYLLKVVKPLFLLMILVFTAIACEKDFVNLESDITGAQNFATNSKLFPLVSYNKKLDPVQTSSLTTNVLGLYNDPNYGLTSASLVSQIAPDDLDPNFGENLNILSVKLYIPYYSTIEDTDDDGNTTYTLDSLFGNAASSYKLSIFKNDYYLRDLDPGSDFSASQAYYSNAYSSLNLTTYEGEMLYQSDDINGFTPSAQYVAIQEIPLDETEIEDLEDNRSPGLYLDLTAEEFGLAQWKELLVQSDGTVNPNLTNSADFKNAFRGLIFKAEQLSGNEGNMIYLNIGTSAKIDVRYETDVDDTTTGERERDTYTFNLNSIKFNTFEKITSPITLTDGDANNGDDQLFISGFQGSMAVIDLFKGNILDDNNITQDALEYFKDKEDKWLINEANLNFYVDLPTGQGGATEPDRIIVYDLKNEIPIVDYFFDGTSNTTDPLNSKIIYSPKLERDADENGVKYKIRLTEHLNSILLNDSTNVQLGLYVSTNVNYIDTSKILDAVDDDTVRFIPKSSVIAPEGTILHGSKSSVPENVRATFEIFYTESQN
ncbi:DUF4270 domain-containing protein [Psychroserpens sp. NJDZ02]|uniref:DUF4270 domain-containing protein n=1 Tax=Psychroserpens sp. NJDZ02 TaxID=2570561 RepID=UPI0010A80CBD|nr:DUF4270 domain-containing protein [Psychroserpens sp. NJDZ02]QCE41412.1 DUF4270 domain-containing protein [Psychroserpens sp. NJDZ02]